MAEVFAIFGEKLIGLRLKAGGGSSNLALHKFTENDTQIFGHPRKWPMSSKGSVASDWSGWDCSGLRCK
eukprot:1935396-Pyramimonas_sp.AAC.1